MRSGSTLLGRWLESSGSYCSVGELHAIWEHAFIENMLCGCGTHIRSCDFWNAVVEEAFGGWDGIDARRIQEIWFSTLGTRSFWYRGLHSAVSRGFRTRVAECRQVQERLYKAIASVSGCGTIIDSSKSPAPAFVMRENPALDFYPLHLVRDSRAVAFSLRRKKRRPEISESVAYLQQSRPMKASVSWNNVNLAASMLRSPGLEDARYLRIRYEDLIPSPESILSQIAEYLGEPVGKCRLENHSIVNLHVNHSTGGNPMRFQAGPLPIQLDDEWRRAMPWPQRAVVTALTWPLLKNYGYL